MTVFDILQKVLKEAKSAYDCGWDIAIYNENLKALNEKDVNQIVAQLQKSINRYGQSIQELSGLTKISVVKYETLDVVHATNSLVYITQNIPMYVAYEQLKGEAFDEFQKLLLGSSIGGINAI